MSDQNEGYVKGGSDCIRYRSEDKYVSQCIPKSVAMERQTMRDTGQIRISRGISNDIV